MAIWNARNQTEKHIFECDYSFLNFAIEILLKLWLHMFKNGFFCCCLVAINIFLQTNRNGFLLSEIPKMNRILNLSSGIGFVWLLYTVRPIDTRSTFTTGLWIGFFCPFLEVIIPFVMIIRWPRKIFFNNNCTCLVLKIILESVGQIKG